MTCGCSKQPVHTRITHPLHDSCRPMAGMETAGHSEAPGDTSVGQRAGAVQVVYSRKEALRCTWPLHAAYESCGRGLGRVSHAWVAVGSCLPRCLPLSCMHASFHVILPPGGDSAGCAGATALDKRAYSFRGRDTMHCARTCACWNSAPPTPPTGTSVTVNISGPPDPVPLRALKPAQA